MEIEPSSGGPLVREDAAQRGYWVVSPHGEDATIRNEQGDVLMVAKRRDGETHFAEPDGREMLVIARERYGPFSRWVCHSAGERVSTIRCTGFWLSKYEISCVGGRTWTLRFPLFTVWYPCVANDGARFVVRIAQQGAWFVGELPDSADRSLLAALIVIQPQRQWA